MFTGLVEKIGTVLEINKKAGDVILKISLPDDWEKPGLGESIAVDGTCLTVINSNDNDISFSLSNESLNRTIVGTYRRGGKVNLERAMRISDRLGGHIVQGHVDGVIKVVNILRSGKHYIFTFEKKEYNEGVILEKGSVAINGVSLTVASVAPDSFQVALLDFTFSKTNLKFLKIGSSVNIELDIIGKYVANLLKKEDTSSGLSESFLKEHGFI